MPDVDRLLRTFDRLRDAGIEPESLGVEDLADASGLSTAGVREALDAISRRRPGDPSRIEGRPLPTTPRRPPADPSPVPYVPRGPGLSRERPAGLRFVEWLRGQPDRVYDRVKRLGRLNGYPGYVGSWDARQVAEVRRALEEDGRKRPP